MSDKTRPGVQQTSSDDRHADDDPRVQQSMRAMREALNTLLGERAFNDITVQQILDRAGVSRATFYAHFRNKDDVLFASFERMVHGLARTLNTPHERQRPRLVPMRELIEHFASAGDVFHSLESSGRMEALWDFGTDVLAGLIEDRLPTFRAVFARRRAPTPLDDGMDDRLTARMLAGACLELVKWSRAFPDRLTPAELDARFHVMAQRAVAPAIFQA
ncbi:MAG TPA: TetR/AcrR family transcriptional regulator [Gemmatimonas aurantiaca]|uniref:TetR family transcriptional regulator n=2 Tax=Gemmatimonas aurantiaca TaxID=173480 RepID=C1ACU5_GEMAT|nr:TetR/AcrR family transcriptional regulator [Gemmatimonas aurantiaca]BAH40322.1 TetR family transcriptional regulator [Gemmatimonas aurantiaca T-27]HCT57668.1 TetR/AcrR family transcriptional regulator [Gemmatimonas aurantiaca]